MNKRSWQKRKKYQREVNRIVRAANKDIKKDWLWDGRFVISQFQSAFYPLEDHSGAEFIFELVCTDTKTGKLTSKIFSNYTIDHDFWRWINQSITEDFDVWHEDPNPYGQAAAAGRTPN